MHSASVLSGWDTALLIVPFAALMAMAMFGLDERLASPSGPPRRNRKFCGVDSEGQPVVSDPDGKRWYGPSSPGRKHARAKGTRAVLLLESKNAVRETFEL